MLLLLTGGAPPAPEASLEQALERIATLDRAGPELNSMIALNPHVREEARGVDRSARAQGPLAGAILAVKDNIEVAGMATTAGSLALADNVSASDAPIVARLRAAGAVVIGKANLSEWANFRSRRSISGWSAIGGLTRNPFALDRTACGSSAGSAVAVATGMAQIALGTETDGSIICPAATMGLVGFKPTLGLVSRRQIVPISPEQDTAGPITRTVREAAQVLTVIAGSDPGDPATAAADRHRADFSAGLDTRALEGARIGVWRGAVSGSTEADAVFERALQDLRSAGAVLVPVTAPGAERKARLSVAETLALQCEFGPAIDAYLASTAPAVSARTLGALIAFNAATPRETALFGQETFEAAAALQSGDRTACSEARAEAMRLAGPEGLDPMFAGSGVIAIVAQSNGPAALIDPVNGSRSMGSPTSLPAVGGYPHLTVPMGQVEGLPVGLSIIGPRWSDARVLALGHAYEEATAHVAIPDFTPSLMQSPAMQRALAPFASPPAKED